MTDDEKMRDFFGGSFMGHPPSAAAGEERERLRGKLEEAAVYFADKGLFGSADNMRLAAKALATPPAARSEPAAEMTSGVDWMEAREARKQREAEIMQEYRWGNLTPLGVANHLRRAGFNIDYAQKAANALTPEAPDAQEETL